MIVEIIQNEKGETIGVGFVGGGTAEEKEKIHRKIVENNQ